MHGKCFWTMKSYNIIDIIVIFKPKFLSFYRVDFKRLKTFIIPRKPPLLLTLGMSWCLNISTPMISKWLIHKLSNMYECREMHKTTSNFIKHIVNNSCIIWNNRHLGKTNNKLASSRTQNAGQVHWWPIPSKLLISCTSMSNS